MSAGTLTPRPHSLGLADRSPRPARRPGGTTVHGTRPGRRQGAARLLGVVAAAVIAAGLLAVAVGNPFAADDSPAVSTPPAETAAPDPVEVANRFVADWAEADWAAMVDYADAAVIDAARRAHVEGMQIAVVGEVALDGGELLLTDPTGSRASIFLFTLDRADAQILRLDGLGFAGDAG